MWSRRHWLSVRVRVREAGKRGVSVWLPPLSLHTVRGAVLSCDGLLWLIAGRAGRTARSAADALQKALAVVQDEGLDVDVRVREKGKDIGAQIHVI